MSRSKASREQAERKARSKARHRAERRHLAWAGSGERCSTCAYRAGTPASGDDEDAGLTRVRLALLDACEPFYCHEPGPVQGRRRLCIGHMSAIERRAASGHYDEHPPHAPEVLAELAAAVAERDRIYHERLVALTHGDTCNE